MVLQNRMLIYLCVRSNIHDFCVTYTLYLYRSLYTKEVAFSVVLTSINGATSGTFLDYYPT